MGNKAVKKKTAAFFKAISKPGMYSDGGTLFLRVAPGGSKQWVQRLVIHGKRHDLGLGGYPLISVAEARAKAFDNRKLARTGGDPLALKRRLNIPTFAVAVEIVIEMYSETWKDGKSAQQMACKLGELRDTETRSNACRCNYKRRCNGGVVADLVKQARNGAASPSKNWRGNEVEHCTRVPHRQSGG